MLPEGPSYILKTLHEHNHTAYVVGGSVRDLLMKRPTHDWDFTTSATPEQIQDIFPESFYDNAFGTVGVKLYDEESGHAQPELIDVFEITTYRTEGSYTDKRRPDNVSWGTSIQEDLARRDFTINAIAYDGSNFIDPFDGKKDIEQQLIRAVGDPYTRFEEDALRMMRAIRFAAQLGFLIEQHTTEAITALASNLKHISFERIRDELVKILASNHPADGILLLKNTGLLQHVLPELDRAFSVPQKSPKRHHVYDVGTHCVMALKHCPSHDPIVRFATLIHDIGKPSSYNKTGEGVITFYNHEVVGARIAREICARLRFSKRDSNKIVTLVRWHQFSVDEHQSDSALRRFIRRVGRDNLDDMLDLRVGDRLGGGASETSWRLELYKKRLDEVQKHVFSIPDLQISGHDVMKILDSPPGPQIGKVLHHIFTKVDHDELPNEREALLTAVDALQQSGAISSLPDSSQNDEAEEEMA